MSMPSHEADRLASNNRGSPPDAAGFHVECVDLAAFDATTAFGGSGGVNGNAEQRKTDAAGIEFFHRLLG